MRGCKCDNCRDGKMYQSIAVRLRRMRLKRKMVRQYESLEEYVVRHAATSQQDRCQRATLIDDTLMAA